MYSIFDKLEQVVVLKRGYSEYEMSGQECEESAREKKACHSSRLTPGRKGYDGNTNPTQQKKALNRSKRAKGCSKLL